MNTFDHFEYRFHLLIYLFIYFLLFRVVDSRLWKLVTSAVQNRQTHTCAAMIYLRNERRWPSCVCVYKLTASSTKGTCTGRVSPHPCSAMFTQANHCARYNSHSNQSGRVYKTGTVAVDGPTERYARGPCNRQRQGVPDLVYEDDDGNEKNTTNDQEKAEVLADFFSSVFTEEDTRKMPHMTQRNFKEWLTNINISKEKIKKKLLELNISKAPGPDGLHPRLLKELAAQLSEPLESIFQLSLKQGKVPNDWRKGEITAIHKKGNRRTAGNYRPVSLTCILCKIMEALVREDIITHMRDNKLFSKYQYCFINKRSTTLQLLYVLDEWTEILDQGGTIDAVYLDFMKAFDKVPHKRLLHELSAYGIGGQAHKWIESFLTGRTQRVKVDSATSGWRKVTSGIPQGSVLGPILFVLYINDMPEALVNNSTAAMFADDTKLYRRTDLPNGVQDLQEDLDHISSNGPTPG